MFNTRPAGWKSTRESWSYEVLDDGNVKARGEVLTVITIDKKDRKIVDAYVGQSRHELEERFKALVQDDIRAKHRAAVNRAIKGR